MKKIISLFLVMLLLCVPVIAKSDEVSYMKENGFLYGTENGLELDREVTRAEALAFIFRVVRINATPQSDVTFPDIETNWAKDIICTAYANGIAHGNADGTFSPDRSVTGREFVKMLLCSMGKTDTTTDNAFEISNKMGLTEDSSLTDKALTRGDVVHILYNAVMLKPFADKLDSMMPKDENYMFSPLSIKMALALTANGAVGETQTEMLKALEIKNLDEFNNLSKDLIAKSTSDGPISFSIANALWVNKDNVPDLIFKDKFKSVAENSYSGTVQDVSDANAVEVINSWVSDKTKTKIPTIIGDSNFALCITNAVYFKAPWLNTFDEENTKKSEFTSYDGSVSQIDFMNQTDHFNYSSNGNVKIIELPYSNYDGDKSSDLSMSMFVIMGDCDAESAVKNGNFKSTLVNLSMPKFKTQYEVSLVPDLKKLGMKKAFNGADLSGISNHNDLFISDILHKTYINVDENGTEAAAVTAIMVGTGMPMPEESVDFKADKPFKYLIRDNKSGEVLFLGSFCKAD